MIASRTVKNNCHEDRQLYYFLQLKGMRIKNKNKLVK